MERQKKKQKEMEKVERDWLLYSKNTNKVYCFACKLYGEAKVRDTCLVAGYNNWRCLSKTLKHHDTSSSDINAYLMWKEMASHLHLGKTIDSELQRTMAAEKSHWRSVLTRIIDCILFLAERNLQLRGKNSQLVNPKNGNFLGILELIARYDVTLAEHLRKAASKQTTGYLTWCTLNEFLDSISECILGKISAQIRASKYFAVELECTHDISKLEQGSFIIRYINTEEKKKVTIAESFVGFTAVKDTTGKGLTHALTGVLENLGLDLANCRGQSYDNGSNMRGINKGVQVLIQQRCPEALFIPCCSHSLNLLLCDAFVYITLKPLSDTRCEAKLDSVKAIRFQMGGILDALHKLREVAGDSKIVSEFLLKYREKGFQKSLDIAGKIAVEMDASPEFKEKRLRKQKKFPDDNSCTGNHEKEPTRHFKCMVFNVIVHTLQQELFSNFQLMAEKFKFITKMEHMTKAELEESVTTYALTTCDVSIDIIQEIYPASRLLKGYKALEKLNFLIQENLDLVFPNLTVALRVFLTMPLTVNLTTARCMSRSAQLHSHTSGNPLIESDFPNRIYGLANQDAGWVCPGVEKRQ
uniref:TTF-type domain-containing protein n=1 Tax=Cyprinodon variegatus TaxID=28743 RepID=A0A3Q2EHW9_CYPVA